MSEVASAGFRTPYTPSPGSSTPSPDVDPVRGRRELYSFALLSLLNTAIIVVIGVVAWILFR